MITAFFKISRSIFASFSAYLNSAISRCSAIKTGFPLPVKLDAPVNANSRFHRLTISPGTPNYLPISMEDLQLFCNSTAIN
jgi:hypothetical protein